MPRIVALAGGVGGAKLAHGLYHAMPPEDLTVIVNTGDDFEHWGLRICPDLDTVCYTLAERANPTTGWGLAGETWEVFDAVSELGGSDWFRIGDLDLVTHLVRTQQLRDGLSLSLITRDFCQAWGIRARVLPMSDQPVRTIVETDEGDLPFQEYFVYRRCEPRVRGFYFDGPLESLPAQGIREAIHRADAIVICPSNPWVSIDPILKVLAKDAQDSVFGLDPQSKPVVAVSPIVGGEAIKGPAAKMFYELGLEPSPLSVAQQFLAYGLSGLVFDQIDQKWTDSIRSLGLKTRVAQTIMRSSADRKSLAEVVLNFISESLE